MFLISVIPRIDPAKNAMVVMSVPKNVPTKHPITSKNPAWRFIDGVPSASENVPLHQLMIVQLGGSYFFL